MLRGAPRLPRGALLLLLAGLAGAGRSGAAESANAADEADLAFQLGNDAYRRGTYGEALAKYFVSYRLAPNRNALFNIARCYEALARFDEAYRYYHDLELQGPGAQDRQEVARALARLRPRVALVRVTTEPSAAELFVDREDLGPRGRSPQILALAPGAHLLLASKLGQQCLQDGLRREGFL